jgi:hypothetical protein
MTGNLPGRFNPTILSTEPTFPEDGWQAPTFRLRQFL